MQGFRQAGCNSAAQIGVLSRLRDPGCLTHSPGLADGHRSRGELCPSAVAAKGHGVSQGTNATLRQLNLYTYSEPQDPHHLVEGQAEMLQFRKGSTNIPVHGGSWQSLRDRWFSLPGNNLKERRKKVSRDTAPEALVAEDTSSARTPPS